MSFSKPIGVELKTDADGAENPKYVDLLDEDKGIAGQKFACLSFISPEQILKQKDMFMFEEFIKSWDFNKSMEKFTQFLKSIEGTNTTVLLTADHGQIDCGEKNTVIVNKHPKLKECLAAPVCGEPRLAYCYIRPGKEKQFKSYIKTKFSKQIKLYKSSELIEKGYFGLGKANPKLKDRVGDYVLVMKDNYAIRQFLPGDTESFNVGDHGGLSKEEMYVPLVVVKC